MCCMYTVYSGMQEWVIQIPSIPILVSVLFPSLHLKYFRIKFLLLVIIVADIGMKKGTETRLGIGISSSPIPVFPLMLYLLIAL